MLKLKGFIVLSAALILFCSCSPGSGAGNTISGVPASWDAPTVTMLMYPLWNVEKHQEDFDAVADLINDLLFARGYGVKVKFDVRPTEEVRSRQNTSPFLETAFEYDMFYAGAGGNGSHIGKLAAEGKIANLTEIIADMPVLQSLCSEAGWRSASISGRIYAFPVDSIGESTGVMETGIAIRTDILEELGIPMPATPTELIEAALTAKAKGLPYHIAYEGYLPPWALHRTYDEWPFFVDYNSLFIITPDRGIEAYPYSDIYMKDVETIGMFAQAGVLKSSWNSRDYADMIEASEVLAGFYFPNMPVPAADIEKYTIIQFNPEKANSQMGSMTNIFIYVSESSLYKRESLELLEAIYSNQDIYDAFVYGIEGVNWRLYEDGTREAIKPLGNSLNHYMMRRSPHNSVGIKFNGQIYYDMYFRLPPADGTAIDFPEATFSYIAEDQAAWGRIANLLGMSSSVNGVRSLAGYNPASMETSINSMRTALRQSGFDTIMDEARRQFEAYTMFQQ